LRIGLLLLSGYVTVTGSPVCTVSSNASVTKSTWPFYLPMLIVLLLVTCVPELSLWLPRMLLN
jgi:TRAP-type C4-dicarboxylate transport system permease large subunit